MRYCEGLLALRFESSDVLEIHDGIILVLYWPGLPHHDSLHDSK